MTGITWNLASIVVDGVLFVILERAMLKFSHVQVVVNGLYFFQKDARAVFAVLYMSTFPFIATFCWHFGSDPFFRFDWLSDNEEVGGGGGNSTST